MRVKGTEHLEALSTKPQHTNLDPQQNSLLWKPEYWRLPNTMNPPLAECQVNLGRFLFPQDIDQHHQLGKQALEPTNLGSKPTFSIYKPCDSNTISAPSSPGFPCIVNVCKTHNPQPSYGWFPCPSCRHSFFPGTFFFFHTLGLRSVSGHVSGTWVILNPLPPGPLSPLPSIQTGI